MTLCRADQRIENEWQRINLIDSLRTLGMRQDNAAAIVGYLPRRIVVAANRDITDERRRTMQERLKENGT